MLILGLVLLILGFILGFGLLETIGVILLVVGAVLFLTHAGDRRWY